MDRRLREFIRRYRADPGDGAVREHLLHLLLRQIGEEPEETSLRGIFYIKTVERRRLTQSYGPERGKDCFSVNPPVGDKEINYTLCVASFPYEFRGLQPISLNGFRKFN